MAQVAAIAATVVSTVGTIVSANDAAAAAKAEGRNARDVGEWQAAQLRQRAGQERASSQRQAENERRAGRLAVSKARAIAAGSGGGASDPTVMNIYSDLEAEGETNALTALWEGEEAARGLEAQAGASQYEGAAAYESSRTASRAYKRAGYIGAAGNLLSSGADFYSKYWPESADAPLTANTGYAGGKFGRASSQLAFG